MVPGVHLHLIQFASLTAAFLSLEVVPITQAGESALKQHSAFYSAERCAQIRSNLLALPNGPKLRQQALEKAAHWLQLTDEEVWNLMFGPNIRRSWMVWSNGKCPACTNDVVMYDWIIKAQSRPWKTQCPRCKEIFPKNDFAAYYHSGLDRQGVFDPKLADRKLLFNQEHPNENDPLRSFGVDDGEGFVSGDQRWRFIGTYLVYGQFKQLVRDGIQALAEAWVLSGDTNCARKAAILLDRVADLYPEFDYAKQAFVYERQGSAGYVSIWHDACEETREMVLAYDQIFDGIRQDPTLVKFLSAQAREHGLLNKKSTFAEIQQNIEDRILRDALKSPAKMRNNFPRMEIAYTTIQAVLGWPENRAEVEKYMDEYIARATAVDGITGEKGLSGYAAYTIIGLAGLLGEFSRADPEFLKALLERIPSLRQTWRFHIDTMCLDRFYPNSGDCGSFAQPANRYVAASFSKLTHPRLSPSMFTFFWQLYEATGDPGYVQVLYRENGDSINGLPHDLCAPSPEAIRQGTRKVIAAAGPRPILGSIHKPAWHIGILRSGEGAHARAVSLDYDAGGAHGHLDGMTLGLFARGADLLPDFGYPPVQHGGWSTPQVAWYLSPAAHNTVTVDGQSQRPGAGQCTLWADGDQIHLMRASAPGLIGIQQFERTVALVDVSPERFYVLDLFRVRGGSDHTKFVHGPRSEMITTGLNLAPAQAYGPGAMMRNFKSDPAMPRGWRAEWRLPPQKANGRSGALRYTDLTKGAIPFTAESNVMPFKDDPPGGFWIPSLLIKRAGAAPLESSFVSTLETFEEQPAINSSARLPVRHEGKECASGCTALNILLSNGRTDFVLAAAEAHRSTAMECDLEHGKLLFMGDTCIIRRTQEGATEHLVLLRTSTLKSANLHVDCDPAADLIEMSIRDNQPKVLRGLPAQVKQAVFK